MDTSVSGFKREASVRSFKREVSESCSNQAASVSCSQKLKEEVEEEGENEKGQGNA